MLSNIDITDNILNALKRPAKHHQISADETQSVQVPRNRIETELLESMRILQRLLEPQTPKIGSLKVENLIDSTIVKKIEDSGFFEKMNAEYGGK